MVLTWLVTAAASVWFLFLLWYTIRAKWWRSEVGRNTFGVSFVLFVILTRLTVLRWVPEVHQYDSVACVVYGLAAIFGLQRIIFVERAQRKNDKS